VTPVPGTAAPAEPGSALGWWRAIVERSTDLLVAYDERACIRYVSPSIRTMLGWTPDDLLGGDGMHVVDPTDRERLLTALLDAIACEDVARETFRARHRDGTWRDLEARATNNLDDPEVAAVLVSIRDVTDRVRAQHDVDDRDERYRAIVDATPDAVLLVDATEILHANPAATALFGRTTDHLVGADLDDLFLGDARSGDDSDRWTTGSEHRALQPAGHAVDTELTVIPALWDGRPALQVLVRDVSDRRNHALALVHQATHDGLTGLPNRSLLEDRLEHATSRAVRTRRPFAVLFIDLDRFKVVNDTLGHEVGDELLRQTAERLMVAVRPGDTVARLGGDEFVVVVEDLLVTDTVDLVVERIQATFATPFTISDREFLVNASIGVLVTAEGRDPRSLLRDADTAMYAAKTRGRGQVARFDGALRDATSRFEDLRLRLRGAIEEEQVSVMFQPIVRVTDLQVEGIEALVRWHHPDRGMLLPEAFLDVADDAGLLTELGAVVIDTTCRRLARWRGRASAPIVGRDLWATINLSHSQLLDPQVPAHLVEALDRHCLPGHAVCIEVTERALLDDPVRAAMALEPLRSAGVGLAIDDFGTGFASLVALRRFVPDLVKIDRSFVSGLTGSPTDAALVRAVIQMGHALGIRGVPEGVETQEQHHLLGVLGCDLSQGFLHGRPAHGAHLTFA
jgi:diguanylate cyclase (GGDEF)-like protein/PAS domain S-box-containing protein